MLDKLRAFASTWTGKILGAFLLVGLAGFGISGVITNLGSTTVANVGSESISTRDFQRAYNAQLNAVTQRMGSQPTTQEALAMGIPSTAINRLASEAVMNQLGREFGLGATEEKLGELVRNDPSFRGTLGNFDEASFRRVLQQAGYTENEYLEAQMKSARRQQLSRGLFGGIRMPETALTIVSRYRSDRRTIEYFTLSPDGVLPPAEPTDSEMQAYLEEHQSEYRTAPTRTVNLMVLSPEVIAESIEVTDEEIATAYERNKGQYQSTESRAIRQVTLPSDSAVERFEQAQDSGESFDTLISELDLNATDLGTMTRARINNEDLAEAAFSLEEGGIALIPGAQGTRAITVTEINEGGLQPLSEVRDEVAQELKLDRAEDRYAEVLDQIEQRRAAFEPIGDIAGEFGLTVHELDVTSSGEALSQVESIPEQNRSEVASAIFNAEQGNLIPTVTLSSTRNVWFDLEEVSPARDQTLDEVRSQVHDAIMQQRTDEALQARVDDVIADLESGTAFADAAVGLNKFAETSQPFTRTGEGDPAISSQVAAATFNGAEGYHGSVANQNGGYVVFQVASITPGEGTNDAARQYIETSLRDSVYSDFITALRQDVGVSINQGVLSNILGLNGTQQ